MLPLLGIGSRGADLRPHQCYRAPRFGITGPASQLSIVLLKPSGQIVGDTGVERLISTLQKIYLPLRILCQVGTHQLTSELRSKLAGWQTVGYFLADMDLILERG